MLSYSLPAAIKKAGVMGLLNALITPVIVLKNAFDLYRSRVKQELNMTPQVTKLQAGLNRLYDPFEKRITITDAPTEDPVYLYTSSENKPVYLPEFLSGQDADFHVNVPGDLSAFRSAIIAFVNKYKLASKRFLFVYSSLPPLTGGGNTPGPQNN